MRLQPRAAAELDLLLQEGMGEGDRGVSSQLDPAMEALLHRLVDTAILHRVPVGTPARLAEVSVVIPVLDGSQDYMRWVEDSVGPKAES